MATSSSTDTTANNDKDDKDDKLHVIFIHLDWGIGGAEQLMLQLATAGLECQHDIQLITSHCDPSHCFAALSPADGRLYPYLHVYGDWIPAELSIFGVQFGRALCSTLRLLYLAYRVAHMPQNKNKNTLIVLDVLPTPLWLLQWCTDYSLLFYCHFPDQLLVRNNNNNNSNITTSNSEGLLSVLRQWYRRILNQVEAASMQLADVVVVNSKFTQQTVRNTFPSFHQTDLPVLYPALEITTEQPDITDRILSKKQSNPKLVVSLNRYERKKNLGLLLEAAAWMRRLQQQKSEQEEYKIVVAGGYDTANVENVEYRAELGQLAQQLQVQNIVQFRLSISDAERQELLETATVVGYTPENEHFGIVPLESMYAGTPVVAANSGGPTETVLDGVTGYLCEPTAAAFGGAISKVLQQDQAALEQMGQAGRKHVLETFGPQRLVREWDALTAQAVRKGRERTFARKAYRVVTPQTLLYLVEAALILLIVIVLTLVLRHWAVLGPEQSILGGVRAVFSSGSDEL